MPSACLSRQLLEGNAEVGEGVFNDRLHVVRREHVDQSEKTLTVRMARVAAAGKAVENDPKTNASSRTLPLDEGLAAVLRAVRKRQTEERLALGGAYGDGDYVACDEAGRPYHPDTLSKRWSKLVKDAGVRHINLHSARHTCGTTLHLRGVPLSVVAAWLGHADARYGPDLCPLPAGCAEGRFGDIGWGCDKHRDNRSARVENEIGSDR